MYVEAEFTWKTSKEAQGSETSAQLRDVYESSHLGLGAVGELAFLL